METCMFDTLAAARTLKNAGFNETQAEAMVGTISSALNEHMATKADINTLKVDVNTLKADVKADFNTLETEIKTLETEIKADFKALSDKVDRLEESNTSKLKELELRMTVRMGAMMFATAFLVLAVARFMFL